MIKADRINNLIEVTVLVIWDLSKNRQKKRRSWDKGANSVGRFLKLHR